MRKLLILFTLIFSLMFSSTSFGEWTEVVQELNGDINYIEFREIKVVGSSVYFWVLEDYITPDKHGYMSLKIYTHVECDLNQSQNLKYATYELSMGEGYENSCL